MFFHILISIVLLFLSKRKPPDFFGWLEFKNNHYNCVVYSMYSPHSNRMGWIYFTSLCDDSDGFLSPMWEYPTSIFILSHVWGKSTVNVLCRNKFVYMCLNLVLFKNRICIKNGEFPRFFYRLVSCNSMRLFCCRLAESVPNTTGCKSPNPLGIKRRRDTPSRASSAATAFARSNDNSILFE